MSRKNFFVVIIILPCILLSISIKIYNVGDTPLRIRKTNYGVFVIDSLGGNIFIIHNGTLKKLTGFSFPLWVDTYGSYGYITDVIGGYVYKVDLSTLGVLSKVWIKRPEMIKICKGKIYVSSQNIIYELDTNLVILRKWRFHSRSAYFYFYKNFLLYMNYWKSKNDPDITVVDLSSGKFVRDMQLGFQRPLRFLSIYDKWVFLDYKTGDVVFVRNFHTVKRINLPPYSYDMVYYKNKIVVSNLFERSIYIIDPVSYRVLKLNSGCQVGDLEAMENHLFLSCIFDNYIYDMENWSIQQKFLCNYPVMMAKGSHGIYILCSDEGKVKFIDLSGKIE